MKELIERLRGFPLFKDSAEAADAIERLTAELGDLPEAQRELMAENKRVTAERDAALAASRHETDLRQQALEEMDTLIAITNERDALKAELAAIHQALTDPENQPNQFGVTMMPPYQPEMKRRSTI